MNLKQVNVRLRCNSYCLRMKALHFILYLVPTFHHFYDTFPLKMKSVSLSSSVMNDPLQIWMSF